MHRSVLSSAVDGTALAPGPARTAQPSPATTTHAAVTKDGVPAYLWIGALAITLIQIGALWDLSWHRSIGRDSFWTPAHLCVQSGGIMAAIVCGYLTFKTTFGQAASAKAASIRVFGFYAPTGAFVAAWGGITMVASAPFDNWWHATYGLDVTIVSPPHAVLLGGVLCVAIGVLLLCVAAMNRAEQARSSAFKTIEGLYLYVGGVIVISQMYYVFFYLNNNYLHGARPYKATGAAVLVVMLMISQAHLHRWSATIISAIYMATMILSMQILPLFPAEPKLGPVFTPVTHMIPTNFPILIIFPALALDLLWRRTRDWKPWLLAGLSAVVFLGVLIAFEWPFADFLMSRWAENRFFGTLEYSFVSSGPDVMHAFQRPLTGETLPTGLVKAVIFTTIGGWIGIQSGRWMRRMQR